MQNLRILVCRDCYDKPQEQLRSIVIPPDPMPVINARPEWFIADETDNRSLAGYTTDPTIGIPVPNPNTRATQDGNSRITQPIGEPRGFDANAVMPNSVTNVAYGVPLQALSIIASGTTTIQVTCSSPHGLSTNAQVAIEGVTQEAAGLFSVTVVSATAFTYQTTQPVKAGSLLTSTSRVITALVGLPYGADQVPLGGGDAS